MPKAIKKKVSKKAPDTETEIQDRIQDIKKVFEKKQKTLAAYGLITLSAVIVVITSYSIHYTKLYDVSVSGAFLLTFFFIALGITPP